MRIGPDCISGVTGRQYPTYRFIAVAETRSNLKKPEATVTPALLRASPAPGKTAQANKGQARIRIQPAMQSAG